MKPFLQIVAQDLCAKLGNDFSRTVIVFPNKRAGLFMNEYLLEASDGQPFWAPRYITINELFKSFMPEVAVNDPIDTTLRIVTLFRTLTQRNVTVDWFYGWAERLLADFDDVDKNMADAAALFRNVAEWKEFDDTTFLTEEQLKELRRFFSEFDPSKKSEVRDNYQRLWDVLHDLYTALNRDLAAENAAYEGAFYRRVVEQLQQGSLSIDPHVERYVIVGFNVLDKVEQELFRSLRKEGKALFYWDYDEYYTKGGQYNEAGTFLRENLTMFPGELSAEHFNNLGQKKHIEMVSASTEAIQAQYVAPWIKAHLTDDEKRTAVVLCNENLLQPVLHALPENIEELNVTKGFPLSHTEVVSLVEHKMAEWERQKSNKPIVEMLQELAEMVDKQGVAFVNRENYSQKKFEDVLQGEAFYQMSTILNRFARIMQRYAAEEQITLVTLRRLVRQVVRQASVPFHGEPAVGLQIMGVLETRCLDFEHIIMLSVNDGMLPKRANDNSFIPYLLRKAFHLTTPERRTAVYAYYFYRLLQRASHVTMTYNTSSDGMATGEMSRFMTQLLIEWPWPVQHFTLNSSQHTSMGAPEAVDKPADLLQRLTSEGAKYPSVSPSALISYLQCQLKFYYQKVAQIKEPEENEGEMKANTFGTIFHRAAELVYLKILDNGGMVEPDYLKTLAKDSKALHQYVVQAFADTEVEYRILEGKVLTMYLANLLRYDAQNGHFQIVSAEKKVACFVNAECGEQPVSVRINGVIDRVDYVRTNDGATTLRVLDYKTGAALLASDGCAEAAKAKSIEDLFAEGGKKSYMLQTFLYDKMLRNEARRDAALAQLIQNPVSPTLLFIRCVTNEKYDPRLRIGKDSVDNVAVYAEDFEAHLHRLLNEILDPSRQFVPTTDKNVCQRCPYCSICFSEVK